MRPLRRAEHAAAAGLLARAFHDDPAWRWLLPRDRRRSRVLPPVFERVLARSGSVAGVTDDLSGIALWLDPGYDTSRASLGDVLAVASRFRSALPRVRAYLETNVRLKEQVHPAPCLVLSGIAVEPALQGRGIGSRLLAAGLERADATRMPAFLTTNNERNVPLYVRHGFVVEAEEPLPRSGPPTWALVRRP